MSINVTHFAEIEPLLKVHQLQPRKAYLRKTGSGWPNDVVVIGCIEHSGRFDDRNDSFTVYGVGTDGALWHSGDVDDRFVEVNIDITVKAVL